MKARSDAPSDGSANAPWTAPRGVGVRSTALNVPGHRTQIFDGVPRAPHQPWTMAEGSLEAIKWAALILMVFDHTNKYLHAERLPVVFQLGRIVMPMFGFVLAYNLARPDALATGLHGRMTYRLALMGLVATPICVILNSQFVNASVWWPLNILFTFLLVVALTYLIDRGGAKRFALAIALFILGGAVVEYLWMGVMCCLGAWLFCRKASLPRLLVWILGTLSLTVINGNTWALTALPIVLMAGRMPHRLSRQTWLFYGFYPAHLLLLLFIRLAWF
jgi:TraX protein